MKIGPNDWLCDNDVQTEPNNCKHYYCLHENQSDRGKAQGKLHVT